jgi:hypothetical protein
MGLQNKSHHDLGSRLAALSQADPLILRLTLAQQNVLLEAAQAFARSFQGQLSHHETALVVSGLCAGFSLGHDYALAYGPLAPLPPELPLP